VVDRHLDPFYCTRGLSPSAGLAEQLWLQTSPELAMKRLLATADCPKAVYQVSRVFRQDELGPLHNPEFTLVEWYRLGDSLQEGMKWTSDLCEVLLGRGPARALSYADAFRQHVGLDPHTAGIDELMAAAGACPAPPPENLAAEDRDGWLDWLLVERVQPHLGTAGPTLLYDYPATQAALARVRPGDPPLAERFELYLSGIELANGYQELCDADELRRRNARANAQRRADGKPPLPEPSRLLAAMDAGLPSAVGVALGFDRLVMLAAGAASLREVIAFPFDRA
jgi:lysyl-tRNA synthetase class 2